MAHFSATVEGIKDTETFHGDTISGIRTSANGMLTGVAVSGFIDSVTGRDAFRIIATGGHSGILVKDVGYITTNEKGDPVFKKNLPG